MLERTCSKTWQGLHLGQNGYLIPEQVSRTSELLCYFIEQSSSNLCFRSPFLPPKKKTHSIYITICDRFILFREGIAVLM
jgi:hypothetical protein